MRKKGLHRQAAAPSGENDSALAPHSTIPKEVTVMRAKGAEAGEPPTVATADWPAIDSQHAGEISQFYG